MNKAVIKMGLDDMGGCLAQWHSERTRKKKNKNPQDLIHLKSALADTGNCPDFTGRRHVTRFLFFFCIQDGIARPRKLSPATLGMPFSPASSSKTFPWMCSKERLAASPSLVLQSLVDVAADRPSDTGPIKSFIVPHVGRKEK